MTLQSRDTFLEQTKDRSILVIGDVMIDQYLSGSVTRISPEAPVPILLHKNTKHSPGGAANVALNIAGLNSKVSLMSAIGADAMGVKLENTLKEANVDTSLLFASEERQTTCKTRVMSGNQHLLRIDQERKQDLSQPLLELMIERLSAQLDAKKFDLVILQDYNKGVLFEQSIDRIMGLLSSHNIPVAVDPKFDNFYRYAGSAIFKPNLLELRESVPFEVEIDKASLQKAAEYIREKLKCQLIIITLSDRGVFISNGSESHLMPTPKRLITDVCGAGDTVISVASLCYLANFDLPAIASWASLCGTIVCQYPGVHPISAALIENS